MPECAIGPSAESVCIGQAALAQIQKRQRKISLVIVRIPSNRIFVNLHCFVSLSHMTVGVAQQGEICIVFLCGIGSQLECCQRLGISPLLEVRIRQIEFDVVRVRGNRQRALKCAMASGYNPNLASNTPVPVSVR